MRTPRCQRCRSEACWKAIAEDERAETALRPCLLCPGHQPCDATQGYLVDSRCKGNLFTQLGDLIDYYALTEDELVPGSGTGRGTERPIGLRVTALDMLAGHDLLGRLGSWEQDWRETFDHAPAPSRVMVDLWGNPRRQAVDASLIEIIDYLRTWLDRACREHPAIDDFGKEIRELHHVLRVAARVTTVATYRVPCPADYGDGDCGRMLKVSPDLDEDVDCRSCGTHWTTRRLLLVAAHDSNSEIWLDVGAAAEMTGVPERTLQRWAALGRIQRDHGRYSLGSVQAARIAGLT